MAEFADLEALIGPPEFSPPRVQWDRLESELGIAFPADFKRLANMYPSLKFDDFLGLFNPGFPSDPSMAAREFMDVLKPLRLRLEGEQWIDVVDSSGNRSTMPPYPIYPQHRGVLQWGMTDNGDRCLWLTRGEPDDWTIIIERGLWWHFPGGLVDFLVGILRRQIRCPLFPEDFPESVSVIQSLD
ncbi:hypothetical protein [Actinomadura sp. K4S16]|uniref:hypothetical protein n=1 Tax=Actinomadura sp. K4S16 TaxID=1316147 RepID=UPI0011EC987E|nr:hypothetical protein [Actinomadura sp. K4S16]